MAIPTAIMDALRAKLGDVTSRRVHQIITEFQNERKIVDHDIAAYALAFEKKIRIQKYLPPETMAQVQKSLQDGPKVIYQKIKEKKNSHTTVVVKIGKDFQVDHPVIPKKIAEEATKMSEIYPYFYVFENSVRNVIQQVLEKNHGSDWWNQKVSNPIKRTADTRMKEEGKNRWHGKRGAHPIYYVDIDNLANIITANWKDFEYLFPSQHWIQANIDIIATSRNVVAHNNPLSNDDIESVKVRFREWIKQIKDFQKDSA